MTQRMMITQPAEHLETVDVGQAQIQQDEFRERELGAVVVGTLTVQVMDCLGAIGNREQPVGVGGEFLNPSDSRLF